MSQTLITKSQVSSAAFSPFASLLDDENHQHIVQFYNEETGLIEALAPSVAAALRAERAVVIVATKVVRSGLVERLKSSGMDTSAATEQGRFVMLDARETLAKFMVDEWPNAARFEAVVGSAIERASKAVRGDRRRVFAFGEMVALLWSEGKAEATIRLEQLWNELARTHDFSLCCAYPTLTFKRDDQEPFQRICAQHSRVISGHSYAELMNDNDRLLAIARLEQKTHALEAEAALRESEQRFQLLVETAQDYAIFMLDPQGLVSTWNVGAERIKGFAAKEIIGESFSTFYPEEDIRSGKPERDLEIARKTGRFEDESWRVRKDGSRFWANILITALYDEAGRLCGFGKITRDTTEKMLAHEALRKTNNQLRAEISERIIAERKLHDSEQSLRNLSGQLLRLQDEERRRFGRELHDSVGQCLAVLKMGLEGMRFDVPADNKELDRQLTECLGAAEQAIKEVRTISYLLHPPMLEEMGLNTAIPWYLDGFGKRSGIRTTLDIRRELGRLPYDVELAIFRILQESLTNVHRHSGSPTAHVRVVSQNGMISLEVRDDGKGIPPSILEMEHDSLGKLGVGLRGMKERMRELGGTLEIFSNETGTTVRATVPCKPAAAASGRSGALQS